MENYIRYYYNFSVGQNTHVIEIYEEYNAEIGLYNFLSQFENSRMASLIKILKEKGCPQDQIVELKDLMRMRQSGIISPEGEYFKY